MSAQGTALSMNIVWNSAIRGSSFLQASVKGIHSYSSQVEKINLLGATKFGNLKRHLESLDGWLGKIQKKTALISRQPLDRMNASGARDQLKERLRTQNAIEKSVRQTAWYSQQDANNQSRASRNAKKRRKRVSGGAVMSTAMALAPLILPLRSSFNFEEAITSVNAKTDTAYSKDIPLLRETAMKLGSSTEWKMTEVARGEEYLTMAGFNPKQIAKAMRGNLALATVGDLDLATSSDISSNILTGFGKKAEQMDRVADVMSKTITTSNVNITEIGESMKYVGTVATGLRGKKAFLETTAMVGLLGNAGIKGSQAGTHLKGMYMRISAPTKKSREAMDALNFKAFDKQGNAKPMSQMIGELNRKFIEKHYNAEDKVKAIKDIFGMIALPSAMALMKVGEKGILSYQNKIDNSSGEALRIQKMKLDTPIGQMKLFGSAVEGLAITMTQRLLPPFKSFMRVMTKGVNVITSWAEKHPKLSSAIYATGLALGVATVALVAFGFVATIAGGGFIRLVGTVRMLGTALVWIGRALLMNPIGLTLTAIAGAGYLIYKNWDWLKQKASSVWTAITNKIKTPFVVMFKWINDKFKTVMGMVDKVKNFSLFGESKTVAERQKDLPKALQTPVNNPLYDPKKTPLHQKGINPNDTMASKLKAMSVAPEAVLPTAVPTAMVESPTAVTSNHLASAGTMQNKQTYQTFHNSITIHNNGSQLDPDHIRDVFHKVQRDMKHDDDDVLLKDVV